MKVLILDGYNLIHRARWSPGAKRFPKHGMTFMFARSLKALVEQFKPNKVYFVIEGYPKRRHEITENYKANRGPIIDDSFHTQKNDIIELCKKYLPTIVVKHPNYECDDTIAYLARIRHAEDDCTIVSTDTDFIQLLQNNSDIKLYNPVKKSYVSAPVHNYVSWKALRGDSSDNIEGFKGIGDKRATKLVENPELLAGFLQESEDNLKKYTQNLFLISLHDYLLKEELDALEEYTSKFDWRSCAEFFRKREFNSMLNNSYAVKFKETFENLETK